MTEQTTALQVAEYNPVAAAMAELKARYAGVIFQVETKDGMKDAKEVRSKLVKLRTGLEATRKDLKEPALRRAQAIDAEAKVITTAIRAIEEPISHQIKQEESRIEAEQEAKAQAERDRISGIRAKIEAIRNIPLSMIGAPYEALEAEHLALFDFKADPAVFLEFTDECRDVANDACQALADMADKMLSQIEAEQAMAAARARLAQSEHEAAAKLAAERAAIEEERAAIARERAELAEARAAIEASKAVPPVIATSEMPITHSNGAPMYSTTTFKDNGEPIMLDDQGKRSVFCDIADDAEPEVTIHDKADEVDEFLAPRHIRKFALATADQLDAFAGKVEACGVSHFANSLRLVAASVREGAFDAALAGADFETLVKLDNDLIDATVIAIDSLGSDEVSAAA